MDTSATTTNDKYNGTAVALLSVSLVIIAALFVFLLVWFLTNKNESSSATSIIPPR